MPSPPNTSSSYLFFYSFGPIQGVSEPFRKGHERSQISKGSSSSYVRKKSLLYFDFERCKALIS